MPAPALKQVSFSDESSDETDYDVADEWIESVRISFYHSIYELTS